MGDNFDFSKERRLSDDRLKSKGKVNLRQEVKRLDKEGLLRSYMLHAQLLFDG